VKIMSEKHFALDKGARGRVGEDSYISREQELKRRVKGEKTKVIAVS